MSMRAPSQGLVTRASRVTVDAGTGYQVHYERFGSGQPVIFISGTACNCQIWKQFQVPALADGYEVVLVDNRDAGKSDRTAQHYGIATCARDLAAVMDALDLGPAHLVGHSMGGRIALQTALDHPSKVRSITLAGSGPGNFFNNPSYPRGIPIDVCLEIVEKGYEAFYHEHYVADFMFTPAFKDARPERLREFETLLLQDVPPLEAFLRHVTARQQFEVSHRLGEIDVPALVIVGEHDRVTKAVGTGDHVLQAEGLASKLPNAELVIIKDAAHGFFWEQPEETNRALARFFRRHDAAAAGNTGETR